MPAWVIEGYGTVFAEIEEELGGTPAARTSWPCPSGWARWPPRWCATTGPRRPSAPLIIGVEPTSAACVLESVAAGEIVTLDHPQDSIMAGLNCATPSLIAWPSVSRGIDAYVAVPDARVPEAMRLLAADGIVAGETGAGGLAGMLALAHDARCAQAREALGLGARQPRAVAVHRGGHRPRGLRAADRGRGGGVTVTGGHGDGTRTVRAATMALLRERGMTTIFGNPGSTELGLLRDFPADFRYVLALHEGVAVAMADGYAQATGRPALVNLHSACGVGNAMGAVVNAFHNRAPLVITAGNQDRRHLELEPYLFARSTALMEPYVKFSHEPPRARGRAGRHRPRLGAGAHAAPGPGVRVDPQRGLGRPRAAPAPAAASAAPSATCSSAPTPARICWTGWPSGSRPPTHRR